MILFPDKIMSSSFSLPMKLLVTNPGINFKTNSLTLMRKRSLENASGLQTVLLGGLLFVQAVVHTLSCHIIFRVNFWCKTLNSHAWLTNY